MWQADSPLQTCDPRCWPHRGTPSGELSIWKCLKSAGLTVEQNPCGPKLPLNCASTSMASTHALSLPASLPRTPSLCTATDCNSIWLEMFSTHMEREREREVGEGWVGRERRERRQKRRVDSRPNWEKQTDFYFPPTEYQSGDRTIHSASKKRKRERNPMSLTPSPWPLSQDSMLGKLLPAIIHNRGQQQWLWSGGR